MKYIVSMMLLVIISGFYFNTVGKIKLKELDIKQERILADIQMIDGGLVVLTFDNCTILQVQGKEDVRFICMDTEYKLNGSIAVKFK